MIGKKIEHYKIIDILGEGGMGIVYKAFDLKLERYIALKILNSQAINNPQFIARFKNEAKNQAKLNHANIVPVYGFTEDKGVLGIAMEYVNGETLEHLIQRQGKLELYDALYILRQVLLGAGYAHSKGFIHRDIKPSNIIINQEGVVKIMDFGISKSLYDNSRSLTRTGTKIGTLLYMSPEQIKAFVPTNQSDIYSIGITFFEMLIGSTPFYRGTDYEIMEAHLKKAPPKISSIRPELPAAVDDMVGKALHKSLSKRYHSCEEFLVDVDNLFALLSYRQEKKDSTAKTKTKINSTGNFYKKVKFYFFAFIFFSLLAGLTYFVYNTVSGFWSNHAGINSNNFTAGENNYQTNPSYKLKSNWKQIKSPISNNFNAITFINDKIGFICGNKGAVLKTEDGGNTWNVLSDSASINLYSINFDNPDKGFLIGENGTILTTSDTGRTWRKVELNVNASLFGITFLKDRKTGFIVGNNGLILKTVDEGIHWNKIVSPLSDLLYDISFSNENDGIITGWNGVILRTTDTGNSWIKLKNKNRQYLRSVSFLNNNIGVIVGGNGSILRTGDAGASWNIIQTNTVAGFYAVKLFNGKYGIILSNKGNIYLSYDIGKTWKTTSSGDYAALTALTITPARKIFIVGYNGKILTNKLDIN